MLSIAFIPPYFGMSDFVKDVFQQHEAEYENLHEESEQFELKIYEGILADKVLETGLEADVVIARGTTAFGLRKKQFELPVVELPITMTDVFIQINEIKKNYGDIKIAVVGTENMTVQAVEFGRLIGLNINKYELFSTQLPHIESAVKRAVTDNCKVILGGWVSVMYAERMGVTAVLLKTGKDSLWSAFTEAKHVAETRRAEQTKGMQFKMMLDYAYEGLISVDKKGKITIFNVSAEKILGMSGTLSIGKKADKIFESRLNEIIQDEYEYSDELVQLHEMLITLNKKMITVRGEKLGCVLTFENVKNLQEQEKRIRRKISSKGYRAKYQFESILGESDAIIEAIRIAKKFARVNSNVLIIGETGTGKELFAQSIHNESDRRKEAFVAVNCAALPYNLLESELFGYAEGAFTGAVKGGKAGLFEQADKGTLFLDEISEIPIELQVQLLRVLQEKEIRRIGSDKITPIDVRIIAATNRNLAQMAEEKKFRKDLYHRINVLRLKIPPLRNRNKDVLIMAEFFIREFCHSFLKKEMKLSPKAEISLLSYPWKGNVRELRNVCECKVVLNNSAVIDDFIIENEEEDKSFFEYTEQMIEKECKVSDFIAEKQNKETELIRNALKKCNGNKTKAAQYLGITRVTLWRKIKERGIE